MVALDLVAGPEAPGVVGQEVMSAIKLSFLVVPVAQGVHAVLKEVVLDKALEEGFAAGVLWVVGVGLEFELGVGGGQTGGVALVLAVVVVVVVVVEGIHVCLVWVLVFGLALPL